MSQRFDRDARRLVTVAIASACIAAMPGCKKLLGLDNAPAASASAVASGSAEPMPIPLASVMPSASAPAAAETAAAAAASAAVAKLTDSDLAVPEDFEEETKKSIDKKNYKSELDKLEKELAVPEP